MSLDLARHWYRPSYSWLAFLLLPLSWIFGFVVSVRRWLYQNKWLTAHVFPVPIVVVGNINVGGTGKTPFVIWLANFLQEQGYKPGIVSRGYGGNKNIKPCVVTRDSIAVEVGDEALLFVRHVNCPVVIGVNRVAAVTELLAQFDCDVVISDDGLQHYALARDCEIAIVDGVRQFGNELLLPAGPLRESMKRLDEVDFVVTNGGKESELNMVLQVQTMVAMQEGASALPSNATIHAVAGIGHPERFFQSLSELGFNVIPHAFADHHCFTANDFNFNDVHPIVMTEKDAVKCFSFADARFYFLPIKAKLSAAFSQQLMQKIGVSKI